MTISEPNPNVRPTGEEAAEFVAPDEDAARDDVAPARDTATGTDPDAKYEHPGFEDKSLGQAVNSDMELADELVTESGGDLDEAEARFDRESAGAPALARQRAERTDVDGATGEGAPS